MKLFEVIRRPVQDKERQAQTATAEPDLSTFRKAFQDQVGGTQNVPQTRPKTSTPELKKASAATTRSRASQVGMSPAAAEKLTFLQSLGIEDEISDDEAARRAGYDDASDTEGQVPDVATIETLPAIINKEIAEHSPVEPEWHQVKHLPGYLKAPIRAMGRQVFGTFTSTPVEDIQVLANVGGQGPNTQREINAVAGWLRDNGERDTDGEMNFERSIPNYGADFSIFKHEGYTFMLVNDFAGQYIYVWPSADEKGAQSSERASIESERRRLR